MYIDTGDILAVHGGEGSRRSEIETCLPVHPAAWKIFLMTPVKVENKTTYIKMSTAAFLIADINKIANGEQLTISIYYKTLRSSIIKQNNLKE